MPADLWLWEQAQRLPHHLRENLPLSIATSVVTTIIMALIWRFWGRLSRLVRRLLALPLPLPPDVVLSPSDSTWPKDWIARTLPAERLRGGCVVADGTSIIFLHGNVKQPRQLDSGTYTKREIAEIFDRGNLDGSTALQFKIAPAMLDARTDNLRSKDPFSDVVAQIKVGVGIDQDHPERILGSRLNCDGIVKADGVRALLEEKTLPWVEGKVRDSDLQSLRKGSDPITREVKQLLNTRILPEHGLVARDLSMTFSSAVFDELERLAADVEDTRRRTEILKRLAEAYDAFNRVFKREFERKKPESQSESARQESLAHIARVRQKIAPFSLEIWLAGKEATVRDIEPRPRHSHETPHIGDLLRFRVRSGRAGYLSIFNLGTSGKLTLLYPNEWRPNNWIEAREVREIPAATDKFEFPIEGPQGFEMIQAFVTSQQLRNGSYSPGRGKDGFLSWDPRIAPGIFEGIAGELEGTPYDSWAEAALTFEVDVRPDGPIPGSQRTPDASSAPSSWIPAGQPKFQVRVWTDSADTPRKGERLKTRNIEVLPSGEESCYRLGDCIVIYFAADRDCYLCLINIGPTGNMVQLFPNQYHPDNFIRAADIHAIPGPEYVGFEFRLGPPPGCETVKAIASTAPFDLPGGEAAGAFTRFKSRDIGVRPVQESQHSEAAWAEDFCRFEAKA